MISLKLKDVGERNLIRQISERFMKGGASNDCAVIESGREYILLSSDLASTHTNIPRGAPPLLIGEFAASINLSDIAAMAGIPLGMIVSLSVSPELEDSYIYRIMEGIERKLRLYDAEILGGDTKEGPALSITGTAVGKQKRSSTLFRSNVRKGQLLCVTGKLGRAASGYVFQKTQYNRSAGIEMMMDITPRIREAQIIAEHGGKFMTDLSDGLFSALSQMKADLSIGAKVVEDEIPVHQSVRKAAELSGAARLALSSNFGGDYELLFTIDNSSYADFKSAMESEKISVSYIGETWDGDNILFNGENWSPIKMKGYEHFTEMPEIGNFR